MTDHHFMSTRVPTKPVSNAVHAGYDGAAKREDGIPLYGMDKELADKAAAKFDPKMEREAREWIEAVTGEALEGTLQEALKSGVVLCALVNALKPGVCKKPSTMKMAFQQMENIAKYLEACSALGVPKHDLFQTVSLYENQDMMAVITNIHSLGRVSGKVPGYGGPTLGAKLADKSVRHFDEETLRKGRAEQTFLGKGSHGNASQAGTVDTSRNIGKMDKVRGIDGLGTDASVTAVGMGSHGHASQAGTFDTSRNIGKVDHVKGIGGLGTDASVTAVGMGSHGHASQAGTFDTSKNISKVDHVKGIDGLGGDGTTTAVGMGSHGHASQAGTFDTSKNIDRTTNIKGIDGLGTDGISQINLGSHGHATQEGMGKMHGTREIVHQTVGGAVAAA
ncbi:hypothetical protein EMIHUDRAFT_434223 [Emiliania huxleyi CCMP1516]|uniref:Calponin-homology (CH) domain-containing protein n=4 Tax=Emiliania huxleyi TaxID=2903 RepID=A0A0D3K8N6_EMIH1|nr:hypothetical protein EMIHUDRAFT_445681 [Emiliania huxleyi CCMP1516]XP_005784550.1 hypothetical protein EMIHUDRAFT_434223 [Emiliania huxleyi CCMP1516]EOD15061.1 hypothetical protein EMIHUDRAFT_445681 [Emiliania huxleyi CCMP1516]EOD32121.1 hypothetical protein EMIHUDRAFT_434223 [Emiliania huxleyi CCMP1516]|eukprot:XP_005767490.1 hypothetical protein EMIHUDRAFT_445681 [Emiliania huxleyi CCMP1516]